MGSAVTTMEYAKLFPVTRIVVICVREPTRDAPRIGSRYIALLRNSSYSLNRTLAVPRITVFALENQT